MTCLALIGPIGGPELLVILIIGLLVFGARLPEVGRSLGKGMMEFKRGLRGVQDEMNDLDRESDRLIDAELSTRRNQPLPRPLETIDAKPPAGGDPQPEADAAASPAWTPPRAEAARDGEEEGGTPQAHPEDPRREPEPEIPDEPAGEAERRA